ncbi:MAG TPA: BadF/BadG/BcrA/BcrD ATPase family protein [Chloroflexota bacterium]
MSDPLVLGVDGGNSKTIALVARLDGTIAGTGRSGCTDMYATGSAAVALQELDRAVNQALSDAGASAAVLAAGAFSQAGADWPEDIALLANALKERGFGRRVLVVNDAIGALRAGSDDGTGVAVVCGTGAAIGARAPDGREWHTSWWQEPQGSRHLAEMTLRAVYRAELQIDPPTALTDHILAMFGVETVEEVLRALTARQHRRTYDHGRVTTILIEESNRGDATACRILHDHGSALGDYTVAAARRTGLSNTALSLVLAGGVLRGPQTALHRAIIARVMESCPRVKPVRPHFEPAVGALMLALETAGVKVDRAVTTRLEETMPPPTLYLTTPPPGWNDLT